MQKLLEKRFPVEAGEFSQKERILPTLPGKLYLSRSAVREVTDKRLPQLNSYLQHLISLPDNIRYDSIVKAFTRQTPQDRDNHSQASKLLSAKPARPAPPSQSHTPRKSSTPPHPAPPSRPAAPPTKPPPPTAVRGPRGKALYQYTSQYGDELSFSAGAVIALEAEVDGSWVIGRLGRQSGLVPLTYLSIIEPLPSTQRLDDGNQSDEWESEEEEQVDHSASFITCYVGGVASSVQVGADLIRRPTFLRLRNAIQDHLGRRDIVLNYRDIDGDLIEIVDQSDLDLMTKTTPLTLYITDQGDHTPYNTHPYR
ncbi:Neutrophil cytosol factor 4 [Geodia barretti]|nr:Neutrophil cytosol factor 4 [Geodia barretti]